jgi:hypothetical protein
MSSNFDLDVRKREITVLVESVCELEISLLRKGMNAIDEDDRFEAMDIINRIERKMMANMPEQEAEHAEAPLV